MRKLEVGHFDFRGEICMLAAGWMAFLSSEQEHRMAAGAVRVLCNLWPVLLSKDGIFHATPSLAF
jgi:hypothetical protein